MSRGGRKDTAISTTLVAQGSPQPTLLQIKEKKTEKPEVSNNQIFEAIQTYGSQIQEINGKLDLANQKIETLNEQFADVKIQNERFQQQILQNEQKIQSLEERLEGSDKRINDLQEENARLENNNKQLENEIGTIELQRSNHFLRFQNLEEKPSEKIEERMTDILAKFLEVEPITVRNEVDEIYRVTTSFAKRNKFDREVHVRFIKKSVRDAVLNQAREQPLVEDGKRIEVLTQVPKRIRENRKNYYFVTAKLIRKGIRYRWLVPEGISFMWNNSRFYLNSVWKAENFVQKYTAFLEETQEEEENITEKQKKDETQEKSNNTEKGKEPEEVEKERKEEEGPRTRAATAKLAKNNG